jgi:hypothetical protein
LFGASLLVGALAAAPLNVDLTSREQSRQFFRAVYAASEGVPAGFTGNVAAGNAGDTSGAFKEAVRLRVNFFRAFAGVGGEITFNPSLSAKCQQAALVGSANNSIAHSPPTNARFYSAAAAEAAGKSNLALIDTGPAAITAYMRDAGAHNAPVGHRRWLLYPQTREMGTGDVPVSVEFNATNALWILDSNASGPRPATRQPYVAWPPAGYVPHNLVFPRWSLSVAGADFSQAYVSVRRNGETLPVAIDSLASGFGENSIVWLLDRQNSSAVTNLPAPTADTTYAVEVVNVMVAGSSQSYRYNVIVYDPDIPTPGSAPIALSGPATPAVGQANRYTISLSPFLSRPQWRTIRYGNANVRFDAESGLGGLIPSIGPYDPIVTDIKATGAAGFRLIHPAPVLPEQTLTLADIFFAGDQPATLSFSSRLGYATARQIALVQVSTDGGISWTDVYQQVGSGTSGESAFKTVTIPLTGAARRTFRVRFNYTFVNGGSAFTQTDPGVGWYLDNIELAGVRIATASAPAEATGGAFTFTPTDASEIGLQARGFIEGYPSEWGTVVTAFASTSSNPGTGGGSTGGTTTDPTFNPPAPVGTGARLVNLSVRTTAGRNANALAVGFNVSGAGSKPALIRAIGPTLGAFGVSGALRDPLLRLDAAGGATILQNDNWGGAPAISTAAARVGAFALDPASLDAVALPSVAPGTYTVQVTPATASEAPGVVLVEVYDADAAGGSRLANVSARAGVGTGGDILIIGFAVSGTGSRNVLIRAVGPTLGSFGVEGVLADPKLEVYQGTNLVRASDNWNSSLAPTFATVGAFALAANSRDAALALSLAPGSYTAQISGVGGTTGVALVEVYELP